MANASLGVVARITANQDAGFRAFGHDAPQEDDRGALGEFLFLILALAIGFRFAG